MKFYNTLMVMLKLLVHWMKNKIAYIFNIYNKLFLFTIAL